jgi:methylenetetrahydrofolate dehydrogenase (NADP+)/methenyltetrahydrofolate cyclohydrolase
MLLLEGHPPAQALLARLKKSVAALLPHHPRPKVAFVLIGRDGPSVAYVGRKKAMALELGFESQVVELPDVIEREALLNVIAVLNADASVHGILVQAPLPRHLEPLEIFNALDPRKDVDGFHAFNMGRLVQGATDAFMPCTPAGIGEMLKHYQIETDGAHVVVVGRSLIVGKPAGLLLIQKQWNATVTLAHTGTRDLPSVMQQADILIVATGKPLWVNALHVKPGAVVVDVGINRIEDSEDPRGFRLVGDVDFQAVAPIARALTPVPGGVGPMTVAGLMLNTWKAYAQQVGRVLEAV